jgi:hypothetical protein
MDSDVRIALFITCINDAMFPGTGRSVITLLHLSTRTNNPMARPSSSGAEIAGYVQTVEPLLRRGATLELDGQRPVSDSPMPSCAW